MRHRLIAALLPVVVLVAACGPRPAAVHPAANYRLFLQEGFQGGTQQITVVNSVTGAVERQLPLGTPAPDWSRLYVVSQASSSGSLQAVDPRSGRSLAQIQIPPAFYLPDLNAIGPTGGLSPNGGWLALSRQVRDSRGTTTSVLVGDTTLSHPFKRIDLSGDFSFDALSNDGSSLYLIERMNDPSHYRVRLYDVANRSMWPNSVVDKREPAEPMNGTRGSSVAAPGGEHVYTVYIRDKGPFIHALGLSQPFAFCVDLPSQGPSGMEQQFFWSLAMSPDGSRLYAVNGSLGTVSVFTTADPPTAVQTAKVPLSLAPLVLDAEAKGQLLGGAALSADGATLFAVGDAGLLAIDTQSLQTRSTWLKGWRLESIRMSSDGAWLYGASADPSKLFQVNPATGATAAVPGVDHPWAVLWAEPEK